MSRKILTIALLVILPFFVSACTVQDLPVIGKLFGGGAPSSSPVTLSMWGLWESPEVFDAVVAKYKETHPNVTINYDDRSIVKPTQYKDTVATRLSQGGVPDIVVVHNSWVPGIKSLLSTMPANLMDATAYSSKFYPVAVKSAVIDGKIYAIPAYYDGLVLVYNKKHFEEIEQATPPTAWEEFRRLALTLTKKDEKGTIIRAGAAIGTADNVDFFSDILGLMFAQAGVQFPSGLDTSKAQDAFSYYMMFSVADGVWNASMPEASTAFAQEKVSMIFVPSWNLLDIIRARPDLDIGVAPVPQALPESPVSWGSFWMYTVPDKSPNKAAAWEFINYLATDEAQLLMFSKASQYRTYGAPYSRTSLAQQVTLGPGSKYLKSLLDVAPNAVTTELAGRAGNALQVNALKEAIDSQFIVQEEKRPTPADALKTAKETILKPAKQ